MVHSISLSYIVNVHLCFETLLKDLYQHIKIYGQNPLREKKQDESWLKCVCYNIYDGKIPDRIVHIYDLCDYYRLIRNSAVHDLYDIVTHSSEYKKLLKYDFKKESKYAKLSAPNTYETICFDDFVMFSRSCIELATDLFGSLEYNYKKVVAMIPYQEIAKWKTFKLQRCEAAIYLYMKINFKDSKLLKKQIPELVALIMARSSNG